MGMQPLCGTLSGTQIKINVDCLCHTRFCLGMPKKGGGNFHVVQIFFTTNLVKTSKHVKIIFPIQ